MLNRFVRFLFTATVLLTPINALAQSVPVEAEWAIRFESYDRFHELFGVADARTSRSEDAKQAGDEMRKLFGVDLFDKAAVKAFGFRTNKPLAMYSMNDGFGTITLCLAAKRAALTNLVAASGELREQRINGLGDAYVADSAVLYHDDGYMYWFLISDSTGVDVPALAAYQHQLARKQLQKSKEFRRLERRTRGDDFWLYLSPTAAFIDQGVPQEARAGILDMMNRFGMEGTLIRGAMTGENVEWNGFTHLAESSPLRRWTGEALRGSTFYDRLRVDAAMALMLSLDGKSLWEFLAGFDRFATFSDRSSDFRDEWGIDPVEDIFYEVSGNVGLLINRIFPNPDIVLYMQVRDANRFDKTLESLFAGPIGTDLGFSPTPVGQLEAYSAALPFVGEVCVGLIDNHFVISTSRERYAAIVTGGGPTLLDRIDEPAVTDAVFDPMGSAMYWDLEKLPADASLVPGVDVKGSPMLDLFGEMRRVILLSSVENDGMALNGRADVAEPGVWQRYFVRLLTWTAGTWEESN